MNTITCLVLLTSAALAAGKAVKPCQSTHLDIYFIADVSKSISDKELGFEESAIIELYSSFDISEDGIRAGLISYGKTVNHVISLSNRTTYKQVLKRVEGLLPRKSTQSGTYLDLALDLMVEDFERNNRQGVPQVAIVFTDGKYSVPGRTAVSANIIHATTNITVVVVGVGNIPDREALHMLATGGEEDNVILTKSYKAIREKVAKNIAKYTCTRLTKPKEVATCQSICLPGGNAIGMRQAFQKVKIRCDAGYRRVGKGSAKCLENGQWDFVMKQTKKKRRDPRCEKVVKCDYLVGVDGGSLLYLDYIINRQDGKVRYQCNGGYSRSTKHSEISCLSSEKWSGVIPTCVQCDVITGIYNGKVKASRPYDDEPVLKFECNSGYELQGKDKLTCKQGKWDHAKPRCISSKCALDETDASCSPSGCEPFQLVNNGKVRGSDYNVDDEVNIICNQGYKLKGSATVKCLKSLQWSDNPKCIENRCPAIPSFSNGAVDNYDSTPGSEINFRCDEGYVLVGEANLMCADNLEWSSDVPKCIAQNKCEDLCLIGGRVDYSGGETGKEHADFYCDRHWQLFGATSADCLSNGKWSNPMPSCLECRKKDLDIIFMVDTSSVFDEDEVDVMRKMIVDVAGHMTDVRVGLISFNVNATLEVALDDWDGLTDLSTKRLLTNPSQTKKVNTSAALEKLADSFKSRPNRDRIAVIINGREYGDLDAIQTSMTRVRATSALVYTIGVGNHYSVDELRAMASGDSDSTVFFASDATKLADSVRAISIQLCEMHEKEDEDK